MYPASIQLSKDSFHQKHTGKNTQRKIAVTGFPRVCGDPVMTGSPKPELAQNRSHSFNQKFKIYL